MIDENDSGTALTQLERSGGCFSFFLSAQPG